MVGVVAEEFFGLRDFSFASVMGILVLFASFAGICWECIVGLRAFR